MNKRIKELSKQAWESITVQDALADEAFDQFDQKFAELIVRECIEQASISNGHGNNQWDKALTFAAKNIKEHFGVEE